MKIDRIRLYHVAMPLITPWRTAYGEDAEIHSLLCCMSSGSYDAWGESAPFAAPTYSPDWAEGIFRLCRQWLAPTLLGKSIESGQQLQAELSLFKGNPFAKAALDNAWWALQSTISGVPMHTLLGATRDEVPVGADFGVGDSIDELLSDVQGAIDEGYPRIKLKFRPGWDIEMLSAVRGVAPTHPIHIDCNSGYTLEHAELFKQVDQFQLEMIEQPLQYDDVVDHAKLQEAIRTPVCLDESINSLHRVQKAIQLKSCRYVNIKPGRVGGLTNAVAIHNTCQAAQIPCWVGGMLESAVGSASCVALAMLDNFTYPADIFPTERFYREDLSDPEFCLHKNADGVPSARALETVPSPKSELLQKWTQQEADLKG